MPVTKENVDDVFTYHAPKPGQPEAYEAIRADARRLARTILEHTKPSADQQAALRQLRETVMTANACIALEGRI